MPRPSHGSQQTLTLLEALAAVPGRWRHGVSLTRETGLKPGTLYPMLIRLDRDGYLESRWEEPERPGRPPRHAYRLTAAGRSLAAERLATRSIAAEQLA
ncbi:MAG: PadR family transcriptional regulator [Sphingomicrobium sp.]|nr:PadR family transcriptional regulator [Sphingomonadales bacterium]